MSGKDTYEVERMIKMSESQKSKSKTRKPILLGLLVLLLAAGAAVAGYFLFFQEKEFSFETLERKDIQELALNTREDFYYVFDEKETIKIYGLLTEITLEDSETEDVNLSRGAKIRLTLKNGREINFKGSGHTLIMEDKAYYVEEDVLDRITEICNDLWGRLQGESDVRTDFSDLNENSVRNVKVYDGISLSYTLKDEERQEVLRTLNGWELKVPLSGKEMPYENRKQRYCVEKENGVVVEFCVDEKGVLFGDYLYSDSVDKVKEMKERQEAWLQAVREETRQMPFKEFSRDAVKNISVFNYVTGVPRELTPEKQTELLSLLREFVLVGKGTKDYKGREGLITEAFSIEMEDGTTYTISAVDDPFILNGKGYVVENEDAAEKLAEIYLELAQEDMPEPVEVSEVYNDEFKVTITSAQSWYQADRFTKNALFTLQLEYIGDEEEVTVFHGDPLGQIDIHTEDGRCVFGGFINEVLIRTTLKKGEPYQVELSAEKLGNLLKRVEELGGAAFSDGELEEGYAGDVFENGSLIRGKYKAAAWLSFDTDMDSLENQYDLKLSVDFEIR